jgi:asparagine synthase (glutamine-hydrolysing)
MSGIAGLALRQGMTADAATLAAMARAPGPGEPGLHMADNAGLAQPGSGPLVAGPLALAGGTDAALDLFRAEGIEGLGALGDRHALALHDRAARRILLARDVFGAAPLYMAPVEGGVAFASAPRALLASGLVRPRIRREARDELLQLQFTTGAETIFEGIARVLPGEAVVIADGAVVDRHRRAALPEGGPQPVTEAEALDRFDRAVTASVAAALADGLPRGVLPGEGIEGAVLRAVAQRVAGRPLPAFVAAVEGTAPAAAAGPDIRAVPVTEAMVWRDLPRIVAAMDDPAADYAIIPAWFLGRAAATEVAGVLCTEGAAELFGGRGRYRSAMRPWWLLGRQPHALGCFDRVKDVLRDPAGGWRDGFAAAEAAAATPGRTRLMAAQAADLADALPNDQLPMLDRCLGAQGLRVTTPFLDAGIVAACWRLPDALKVRGRRGQWLLRQWLARHHPAPVAEAPRHAPAVPIAAWIAGVAGRLGPLVAAQPGVAEIARPDRVAALFRAAGSDKHRGFAAWHLLFYALWHRAHVEGLPADGDVWEVLAARG